MPVAGGKHTFGFSASSGGWCAAPCGRSSEVAAALLLCSPVVLCLPNSASRSCRMLWWRGGGSCSPGCLHSGGVLGCCRAVGGVGLPGCCMNTVASVRGLVAGVAAATARCGLCLGPLRRGGPELAVLLALPSLLGQLRSDSSPESRAGAVRGRALARFCRGLPGG